MLDGRLLNERYQIIRTIGGGGMANVYLAKDLILNRDVAIKVLRLEFSNDEEFIARFDREAQSATSLSHPNIVNIYDVGEEEHILYMVMEYVDGMTLKEYIQRFGPIAVREAIAIMKQITSAITHAHENNIVHRDIKPQNIMIDTYGNVKVTDFGIAVALSATSLTQTNSILGSVHYLSPEQARGRMATRKSDIYSLGMVFYELLTGALPFSGQSAVSIALKHLQSDTPSVRQINPSIPQSVENVVLKAMAKDPFHRYEDVYAMEESLNHALDSDRLNEEKYVPPEEDGDETKAIPIITDKQQEFDEHQDTLVHQPSEDTKKVEENKVKPAKKPKKSKPKKKRKKKWVIIIILLFLLLAGSAIAFFTLLTPKEVQVPDLTEMEYDEAVDALEEINLQAKEEQIFSDDIEEDLVVKTSPKAGKTVKENSTVTVYVSDGKEKVAFEDYVGKDFTQVKRVLEDQGYEVIAYEKYSDKPEGEIISQIQPVPDTEVVPDDTRVIFEVSNGPEKISLNNLKGMTEGEAKEYLEKVGLSMNKEEEHSDSTPKGEVIRQSPESNTALEKGATVDVYISIGPEEKPPASHSVTFTVPYTLDQEEDEEGDDLEPQTVKIYIDDMNHSISEVYKEEDINEDSEYTITLTIEPGKVADYKVVRDDDIIIDKSVPYEEGD